VRRLLLVSPHFPPDASAGAHRARLLGPHLAACGWQPTVLTVDARDYEGALDPGLLDLVPADLDVVRARALPAGATRLVGVGDLGLRAFAPMLRAARRLLDDEHHDALFITLYPSYTALLGPLLAHRHRLPFVLDYQDPWVGAWGATVGPGGRPDWKSRLSRALATRLEPRALAAADAVTAVSRGTWDEIERRYPSLRRPFLELPIGFDTRDVDAVRARPRPNRWFDPHDGRFHVVAVGTLLPLALSTLRALLAAVALLRTSHPRAWRGLRLHFLGTSNQRHADAEPRVLPVARELGVEEVVSETAPRLDYLDALSVQLDAGALLLLGSSEPHYTASRLFPSLMARRPLLALYHEASSVSALLRRAARPPSVRLVTFDEAHPVAERREAIRDALAEIVAGPGYRAADVDEALVAESSAPALARRLGAMLDGLCEARA
jgi:hypothetical protein